MMMKTITLCFRYFSDYYFLIFTLEFIDSLFLEIANISAPCTNKQTKSSILQFYSQNRITQCKGPASIFQFFYNQQSSKFNLPILFCNCLISIQFENMIYRCFSSVIFPAASSEKLITSESEMGWLSLCSVFW